MSAPALPAGLRIRVYEATDHDEVWRLHLEGVLDTRAESPDVAYSEYERDLHEIEAHYVGQGCCFWVVDGPDGLAGMAAISRIDGETGRLRRMRVTNKWRRRGVAQALLDTAVAFCREQGYRHLVLDTTEQQTAAQRLYEQNGFVRVGERWLGPFRVLDYERDLS